MTEYAKNMMVGLTVIVAMAMLGWMIILFTGLPMLLTSGYHVHVRMQARSQVEVGDKVHLEGMEVGTVSKLAFTNPENPYKGVTLTVLVDSEISLPSNTVLWVTKQALVGRPWLEFFTKDQLPEGKAPKLSKTKPDVILGFAKEASILPKELTPALKGLASLTENLNELISPKASQVRTQPSTRPASDQAQGLAGTLANLDVTLKGLSGIFGDVENQANIKVSLKNLAKATDKANEAMEAMKKFASETRNSFKQVSGSADKVAKRVDQLAVKLIEDAEKISKLLATVNRIALKLEKGDGTAGKILNDPKLYNNLQEAANQTQILLKEFTSLVKTWKEDGIKVKM
jgi:phospholipid/cholesterol/gamma-HCH transport system substrate-binding protein